MFRLLPPPFLLFVVLLPLVIGFLCFRSLLSFCCRYRDWLNNLSVMMNHQPIIIGYGIKDAVENGRGGAWSVLLLNAVI